MRIGAVSYLNTRPLLYGLRKHKALQKCITKTDYPARIAEALMDGSIDIGLIPVAVIPRLNHPFLISNYCIGCDGPVASVAIFGERSIEEMRCIWMDYQSRTSVALARILLRDHWGVSPEIRMASDDSYLSEIQGDTGGLVIGDRAFLQAQRSTFTYDLGKVWKAHTGLPFVFATWVANKSIEPAFIELFNEANEMGLAELEAVVMAQPSPPYDLSRYYTENIRYHFDDRMKEGLQLFLKRLQSL